MIDFGTHDLLELSKAATEELPDWLTAPAARWCVVRREGVAEKGKVSVGFRGPARHHRFALRIARSSVKRVITPEDLKLHLDGTSSERLFHIRESVRELCSALAGYRWGVGGSTAFELATGIPSVHPGSDLDIIIRMREPPSVSTAAELSCKLDSVAVPTDALIELPDGGFVLKEYARGGSFVLRTSGGPLLRPSSLGAHRSETSGMMPWNC